LRPFSQKHWQEQRILYAAEQRRKHRFWVIIGVILAALFMGAVVVLSITAFPESDTGSTFMTGE
jgi:hypothetical protein